MMIETIVVSSEPEERDHLAYTLRHAGLSPLQRKDLVNAINDLMEKPIALIVAVTSDAITDIEQIRNLRSKSDVPLILLGEMLSERDKCDSLNAGADLVMSLPVGPQLLVCSCQALLRRAQAIPPSGLPALDLGIISLIPATRTVKVEGHEPLRLTKLEFQLLYVLISNRGQVIPSDVIVERVWGYSERGNRELVRGLVSRLRAKIEPHPSTPNFIHTIPGEGYLFDLEAL
jgi:DNA-binding response OmpR family regulator